MPGGPDVPGWHEGVGDGSVSSSVGLNREEPAAPRRFGSVWNQERSPLFLKQYYKHLNIEML